MVKLHEGAGPGSTFPVRAGAPSLATTLNCQILKVEALPPIWVLPPARC